MAQLSVFRYLPGNTLPHRLDPRLKLPLTAVFTAAALSASPSGLFVPSALLAVFLLSARISAAFILGELRRFIPLFLVIAAAAFFAVPAELDPRTEGAVLIRLSNAFLAGIRFVLMVSAGILLTATTRLNDLRRAVEFYLQPVPFVNEKKAALMIELMIAFFPLLFVKMDEIAEATASRSAGKTAGVRHIVRHRVLPLFSVTFALADEVTAALESRCYSENRTSKRFSVSPLELGISLSLMALLSVTAFAAF